ILGNDSFPIQLSRSFEILPTAAIGQPLPLRKGRRPGIPKPARGREGGANSASPNRGQEDGGRLFIGRDGGIFAADVVFGPPDQPWLQNFVTVFNKHLANLQFSGWSRLGPWASFSVNDAFAAGGLQHNGNVYTRWIDQSPWRQAADSDGQLTLLIAD